MRWRLGASEVNGVEPTQSGCRGTRAKGCSNEDCVGGGAAGWGGLALPVSVDT